MEDTREINREPNVIVFAKQTFTTLQKDIFTLAVSQLDAGMNVQPDLFKNQTVTITAKMLTQFSQRHYTRLKQECKDMAQKVIEISNDAKQEFDFIVPFPRIKYSKGIIELTMFSDVAQSFLELKKGYAEYYIRESLSLEHFNKKRMYELLSAYKRRNTPIWRVYDDELKYFLGLEKNEYAGRPKMFGTNVIGVCIDAINDKTSISVKYNRTKDAQGWFTVFEVADKKRIEAKEVAPTVQLDEKSQRLAEKLKKMGIRKDLVDKIVAEHQPECWKWFTANKANLEANAFRSPSGVLLSHLGLVKAKAK